MPRASTSTSTSRDTRRRSRDDGEEALSEEARAARAALLEQSPLAYLHPHKRSKPAPTKVFLYGMSTPRLTQMDACAGCRGPTLGEEEDDDDVLLCDGRGCGREYHLRCCVPRLAAVPAGAWFCIDCSESGSSASLEDYFTAMAEAQAAAGSPAAYLAQRLADDIQQFQDSTVVESELEAMDKLHALAVQDVDGQRSRSSVGETAEAHPHLGPEFLVGKPLRLYDDRADLFHTGRIVDYRAVEDDATLYEYYVRFAAGVDARKRTVARWMILEQHNVAVGTSLVYVNAKRGSMEQEWVPAMLWLHSTRALLSLQQAKGGSGDDKKRSSQSYNDGDLFKSKANKREKLMVLAKPFDVDYDFAYYDVRTQVVDFHAPVVFSKFGRSDHQILMTSMAIMEEQEQRRVQFWRSLELFDTGAPKALSARDMYALGPLVPVNARHLAIAKLEGTRAELCPTVSRGLDRARLLERLHADGIEPTKDVGSTLSCKILSLSQTSPETGELVLTENGK